MLNLFTCNTIWPGWKEKEKMGSKVSLSKEMVAGTRRQNTDLQCAYVHDFIILFGNASWVIALLLTAELLTIQQGDVIS